MADNGVGMDLLKAIGTHAPERSEELDREASELEARAMRLRVEALRYRAHARIIELTQ